jgi:hypothetical protein
MTAFHAIVLSIILYLSKLNSFFLATISLALEGAREAFSIFNELSRRAFCEEFFSIFVRCAAHLRVYAFGFLMFADLIHG